MVAFIPARGGSKGIPGKNLAPVGGRPLVARTVDAARRATTIDRVVVTTDDSEIARVAAEAGADVIERPAELSGDAATSESALLHALETGFPAGDPNVMAFLQCTSPFTTSHDIDAVVGPVRSGKADSAFSAAPSHRFLWRRNADGGAIGVNHDSSVRLRRQDSPPEWVETGAVYAMRVDGFRAAQHRFFGRVELVEVDPATALEIDDPADLDLVRSMAPRFDAPDRQIDGDAVVLDFDGVLTDDLVLTLQDGTEGVTCSRRDGMGVEMLRRTGVPVLILSKERNPVVAARAAKLRVESLQGIDDKLTALTAWAAERQLDLSRIIYVGNDVNDLSCVEAVGTGVAVADADPRLLAVADVVLDRAGGTGAVRELADRLLAREEPIRV